MTISCLRHASIITLSAIWLELLNLRVTLSRVTKCHSEHQTLFTHICEGSGTRLFPNVLCGSYPNCVLNLHLRYSCTFAYSQTWRTYSIFSITLPSYHKSLSAPSSCSLLGYSVYQIASQTTDANTHPGSHPTFNILLAVSVIETAKTW